MLYPACKEPVGSSTCLLGSYGDDPAQTCVPAKESNGIVQLLIYSEDIQEILWPVSFSIRLCVCSVENDGNEWCWVRNFEDNKVTKFLDPIKIKDPLEKSIILETGFIKPSHMNSKTTHSKAKW